MSRMFRKILALLLCVFCAAHTALWAAPTAEAAQATPSPKSAEAPEGLDQRPHRAPPHLRHAVDTVKATGSGGAERGQESRRGAGEADEEIGFADAEGGVLPGDGDRARRLIGRDLEAEAGQRRCHQPGVVAEQRARQPHRLRAERGEEQGTVGETLGTGRRDLPAHGCRERYDGKEVGQ